MIVWLDCAQQVPPTGGPPDKTPPRVVTVLPENSATLVPLDQKIEFEFSEPMNQRALERAIFITPDPGERVKLKLKGRRLRVQFEDALLENRTYIITLGTDLQDTRGNALSQSYTLAFSTGAEISDGKVSGRVYDKQPKGVLLWAYILENDREPNPVQENGDYITQTDDQGRYELTHLSEGRYRIFAVKDTDNNRFFEIGLDGLGVPVRDVELLVDTISVKNIDFKISVKDTIGPALTSVTAPDESHLFLRFDEEVATPGISDIGNYQINKKGSAEALDIVSAWPNIIEANEIVLLTGQQQAVNYEIQVQNLTDRSGNSVDPDYNYAEFVGVALSDTFKPAIVKTVPADSSTAVLTSTDVEFYFDDAVQKLSFENGFLLSDSSGVQINGSFEWPTPAFVKFTPDDVLQSKMIYRCQVVSDSLVDAGGNVKPDTIIAILFTTINVDTFSTILGTFMDEDSSGSGPVFLTASPNKPDAQPYVISIPQPGSYEFSGLLPGVYALEAFRDRNGDGQYTYGNAVPFEPAERFVFYADSVNVRSRWPNEGNDITLLK
jgi:uncharacterized protein (DUF2141 family)